MSWSRAPGPAARGRLRDVLVLVLVPGRRPGRRRRRLGKVPRGVRRRGGRGLREVRGRRGLEVER